MACAGVLSHLLLSHHLDYPSSVLQIQVLLQYLASSDVRLIYGRLLVVIYIFCTIKWTEGLNAGCCTVAHQLHTELVDVL